MIIEGRQFFGMFLFNIGVGKCVMNNSIPTLDSNKDKFNNLRINNGNNTQKYWLPAKNNESDKFKTVAEMQKIIMTPEEARKTNNTKVIGLSVAGATVLTAAGIFFFLKGGSKGLTKGFLNLRNYIENRILNSKLNTGVAPNKIWLYLLKGTDNVLAHAEALNNFTSFKDVLFTKIMGVTKFTKKIHSSITNLFEKIGRRSVMSSYRSSEGKFKEIQLLSKSLSARAVGKNMSEIIEIDGVSMTKQQWLDKISSLNAEIALDYSKNFGQKALRGRYTKMKHAVQDLFDKFKDMKIFLSKDTLTRFIAEENLQKEKAAIQKAIKLHRQRISYSLKDMTADSNEKIMEIVKILGYKNSDDILKLGTIRGNLQKYVNSSGKDEIVKQQIIDDITELRNTIELRLTGHSDKNAYMESLLTKLDDLKSGIETFEQGKVEQVLKIYKHLLPADKYDIIADAYKEGVKSLDKSIKIESEDFMSKLRDLTLGSAPTDILTILGSFGVLGYHLGKSKDNDQRQSIALKYGFPAIAGIGVSLFCNAKLFAGSKSLLVGAASTWVLNRIGEWGDKQLKKRKSMSATVA